MANKDKLFCLASGKSTPKDVTEKLLHAENQGREAMEEFIQNRLVNKPVKFHEPGKQMKLKTFALVGIVKTVKGTQNKVLQIKAERNIFVQLVLLSVEHHIDLQVTLSNPLGPVPFSLATADGMPFETDKLKSKLLHNLEANVEAVPKPTNEA